MKPLFIDIETTGLDPYSHEIIELAAIQTDDQFVEQQVYEVKIRPLHLNTAHPKALEVNGYNEFEWRNAMSLREALEGLLPYLDQALVFGHNVQFDWKFITLGFKRLGLSPPTTMLPFQADSMHLADELIKDGLYSGRRSLTTLCKHFGIVNDNPHRALGDARACLDFVRKVKEIRKG